MSTATFGRQTLMRKLFFALALIAGTAALSQERDLAFVQPLAISAASKPAATAVRAFVQTEFAGGNLLTLFSQSPPAKLVLGYSEKGRPVEALYFPGSSTKKALVIAGVHGSELSAVEVAKELTAQLQKGRKPYYNVIVIPTLFPENAAAAEHCVGDRVRKNAGRYTHSDAIDPNRQMPALGKPFCLDNPVDAFGRRVETENRLLLQLVQAWSPDRILNLHAIKDTSKAGVYADPRTDCDGRALGFASDSALALAMARFIGEKGGVAPGNNLMTIQTALYHLDPKPVSAGEPQPRNLWGMNQNGRIAGVSLGSWASTAVCDNETGYNRPASRLLTMEFPGYKKPSEYRLANDRIRTNKLVQAYAAAIRHCFLEDVCVEDSGLEEKTYASR